MSVQNTKQLIDALVTVGLLSDDAQPRALEVARTFSRDDTLSGPVEPDLAAYVLSQRGCCVDEVVSHDSPFWDETDDVIAEFSRGLRDTPIRCEQLGISPGDLLVRTFDGATSREVKIDIDGGRGLDAVVEHLNQALETAAAPRRIHALETGEFDWRVFVACNPQQARVLIDAGQVRSLYGGCAAASKAQGDD